VSKVRKALVAAGLALVGSLVTATVAKGGMPDAGALVVAAAVAVTAGAAVWRVPNATA
jgi:hypothetical protein